MRTIWFKFLIRKVWYQNRIDTFLTFSSSSVLNVTGSIRRWGAKHELVANIGYYKRWLGDIESSYMVWIYQGHGDLRSKYANSWFRVSRLYCVWKIFNSLVLHMSPILWRRKEIREQVRFQSMFALVRSSMLVLKSSLHILGFICWNIVSRFVTLFR